MAEDDLSQKLMAINMSSMVRPKGLSPYETKLLTSILRVSPVEASVLREGGVNLHVEDVVSAFMSAAASAEYMSWDQRKVVLEAVDREIAEFGDNGGATHPKSILSQAHTALTVD